MTYGTMVLVNRTTTNLLNKSVRAEKRERCTTYWPNGIKQIYLANSTLSNAVVAGSNDDGESTWENITKPRASKEEGQANCKGSVQNGWIRSAVSLFLIGLES